MGTSEVRVSVIHSISKLIKWDDLIMQIISNCTHAQIKKAAEALKNGHLVSFPTETVYGLGADAVNEQAIARIYEVKGRPTDHPLIVHISSLNLVEKWAVDIPEYALKLAHEFWPGPMTLILRKSDFAQKFITGNQETVGLRVPSHPIAIELLTQFRILGGAGIAAPSANRFGAVSPTNAKDVIEEIGTNLRSKDLVLDGGQCQVGVESTIIDCSDGAPNLLRPGAITTEIIRANTGLNILKSFDKKMIRVPGVLNSHYSPKAKVVLDKTAKSGDGFIAMADIPTPNGAIRLAKPLTVEQYARGLYAALRLSDKRNLKQVVVIQPTGGGLALVIRDRLSKSASNK